MNSHHRNVHGYNNSKFQGTDPEEVRAFGRQTILENLDFSNPHDPPDPRSNRAENFVYFPDQERPEKRRFSLAPGEPIVPARASSDGRYIMTPSPSPPKKQIQNPESHIPDQKIFNSENRFENNSHPTSKTWHPFVPVKPEESKLNHSESPGRSSSPTTTNSESKPSQSASSDRLNMHTFIKSLSATKIPKKEEPLNNDQLSFWQQLVKTTKKNERENVENFFKMFKNSSPNRNDILEPEDFEDEFNHERDLMKELAFLNVETQSNKSPKSDEDLFASKFFQSLLQRSQENITASPSDNEHSDQGFEPDNSEENSEFVEESDSGEQKSETPVVGENLEPDGGPPNYLELDPPPIETKEVAPEENELKVNDE